MRLLTADTTIKVKQPLPLPRRRELTGDTRIRLSQIVDLLTWRTATTDEQGVESPDGAESPKGDKKKVGGQWKYVPVSERGGGSKTPREYSSNFQDNKKKLSAVLEETKKKLTTEEVRAIKEYTESSKDLNAFSRGKKVDPAKIPQLKTQQKALDNALNKSHVGENVIAYRAVNVSPETIDSIIPLKGLPLSKVPASSRNLYLEKRLAEDKIRSDEKGYISTTINPNYQMNRPKQGQTFITYKINVPKEAHGLYLGELSAKPHQEELLVLRNYSLDLKKIRYDANRDRYEIEAELILKQEE